MNFAKILLLAALLVPCGPLFAHQYQAGELYIDHPWSREMPPSAPTAAAYFVIQNQGAEADRLLGVATPAAGRAELHEHVHVGGMMKMQPVASVAVPAHGEVRFAPGGYHVMLFELPRQFRDGERFPLTLRFEKAGEVEVAVAVQKDAPAAAPHAHDQGSGHDH